MRARTKEILTFISNFQIPPKAGQGGPMKETRYTLKQLSQEFDMSLRELRKHIKQGTLNAAKEGRCYWVTASDLERFVSVTTRPVTRNYLCQYYDACLNRAALENKVFGCDECIRFRPAEKQVISPWDLGGMISLWESVFGQRLSI
jgi:hypothetical protein